MRRTRHVTLIAAAIICAAAITGCTPALAEQPADNARCEFRDIHDYFAPRDPSGATRIAEEQAQKAAESQQEAAEAAEAPEPEHERQEARYEPYSAPQPVMGNPDGLNSYDGVYEYNGHRETYYATHAVYDDQLWVDEGGFFRDDQGRYVVASSDYEQGTVIETSQGEAVVMDGGCGSGVVDFHVTWGR